MASISIKIDGVDKVIRKLGSVRGIALLEKPMQESLYKVQGAMQEYPVQRTGSTYIRTGTLGRRWVTKMDMSDRGIHGTVGNNTEYAPFVQSAALQSRVHRGRWQTDQQVITRLRPWIVARFKQAIDRALRGT